MLEVRCSECQSAYSLDERRIAPAGLRMRCPRCGCSFVVHPDGTTTQPAAAPDLPALPKAQPADPAAPRRPKLRSRSDAEAPEDERAELPHPLRQTPDARATAEHATPLAPAVIARARPQTLLDPLELASSSLPATPAKKRPSLPDPTELEALNHTHNPSAKRPSLPDPFELGPIESPARSQPEKRPSLPDPFELGPLENSAHNQPEKRPSLPDPFELGPIESPAHDQSAKRPSLPDPFELDLPQEPAHNQATKRPSLPDPFELTLPDESAAPRGERPLLSGPAAHASAAAKPPPATREQLLPSLPDPFELDQMFARALDEPAPAPAAADPFELDLPASSEPKLPPADEPSAVSLSDFGELSMPSLPPPSSGAPSSPLALSIPAAPTVPEPPPAIPAAPAAPEPPPAIPAAPAAPEPPPAIPAAPEPPAVPAAPSEPPAAPSAPLSAPERAAAPKGRGRGRYAAAALLAALALGGSMELTPLGAFGRHALGDQLLRGARAQKVQDAFFAMQTTLQSDHYSAHLAADAQLQAALTDDPRAFDLRALLAYRCAFTALRFGADEAERAHCERLLARAREHSAGEWLAMAEAANLAAANSAQYTHSLAPSDHGVGLEIQLLDGFAALQRAEWGDAATRFSALKTHGGLRTLYGLAAALAQLPSQAAEAERALTALLALDPDHPEGLILRARALLAQGHSEQAQDALQAALRQEPAPRTTAQALTLQGTLLLGRDELQLALDAFTRASLADPDDLSAQLGLGETLFANKRYDEARARFAELLTRHGDLLQAALGVAKCTLRLGEAEAARARLQPLLAQASDDPQVHLWLGDALGQLDQIDAALAELEQAARLFSPRDPQAAAPYLTAARLLSQHGQDAKARAWLERATTALPASAALDRARAELAIATGRYDDAVRVLQAALQRDPTAHRLRLLLAETLQKSAKYTEAERELDALQLAAPDLVGLDLQRGLLLQHRGQLDKALQLFQQAQSKAPEQPEHLLRVGAAYLAIGRATEALPLLETAQRLKPQSAEALHLLGRARLMSDPAHSSEALRLLQRACELDPSVPSYFVYYAQACNESAPPRTAQARDAANRALTLDPLDGDAYLQRGVSLLKEGSYVSASTDLQRAVSLRPERAAAWAALAEARAAQSQDAAALAAWTRAVQLDPQPPYWRYRYARLIAQLGSRRDAVPHIRYAISEAAKLSVRPGWLTSAQFEAGELFRHAGLRQEAIAAYQEFLAHAPASSPDRRDAERGLQALK